MNLSAARELTPIPGEALLRRFEDKYFVEARHREDLLAFLEERLAPCYLGQDTRFNLIESIYFDSRRLDLFRRHFELPVRRFKVRTRRYAANGVWEKKEAQVELKLKEGKISDKSRFCISHDDFEKLLDGELVDQPFGLRRRNPTLRKNILFQRVAAVNSVIRALSLEPQCKIVYRRHAFEKDGIRVTVDENIQAEVLRSVPIEVVEEIRRSTGYRPALAMKERFQRAPHLICEIKYGTEVPLWLRSFMRDRARKVRFSKYCYVIAGALDERVV